jgi:Flp pilus assembly protein TadD
MLAVGGWPRTIAEAEWAVREALRINASNVSFHGTLALVLVRLGRHAEAERLATAVIAARMQALAISPKPALRRSLAENRCTLALLYAHTGRPADARPLFNEALALNDGCLLRGELERTLVAAA